MKTIILLFLMSLMALAQTHNVGQTNANVTSALEKALAQPDSNTVYRNALLTKLTATDTASLSNRINLKLTATDTASLSNRINLKLTATDTSSLSNRINLKLTATDTASLSNRINLKLTATDTLSLSNRINTKLTATDTLSLSNRIDAIEAGTGIDTSIFNDLITEWADTVASDTSIFTMDEIDKAVKNSMIQNYEVMRVTTDDEFTIFWTDDAIVIDSIQCESDDSVTIQVDLSHTATNLFTTAQLINGTTTLSTFAENNITDKTTLQFTQVGDNLGYLRLRIYWSFL